MKLILSIVAFTFTSSVFAQSQLPRVPAIFTGNSPAPAYQNYAPYKNKYDPRDSRNFAEYYLDLDLANHLVRTNSLRHIHTHVRNIARDGLCGDYQQCFRVYVYANGDQVTGQHLATFAVSPGTGRRTPLMDAKPLRTWEGRGNRRERATRYENFDMYRIYGSKKYPDPIPNMPNAMFFTLNIALHGSFGKVNGTKESHGCVRMNPDESYWLNTLVRHADGNLTIDILHTR